VNEVETPAVRVGVVLAAGGDDLAEWLADGAAFEAAGAEALHIQPGESAGDPVVLAAALAVSTSRALLLVEAPAQVGPDALATLARLARGRLRVIGTDLQLSEVDIVAAEGQRWLRVPDPEHRAAWRETTSDAVARGYERVMVPANPRLLDILRNPDEPDERRDLHLAQG
jgi:hypothetical protein